jgi:hypothetical protein
VRACCGSFCVAAFQLERAWLPPRYVVMMPQKYDTVMARAGCSISTPEPHEGITGLAL